MEKTLIFLFVVQMWLLTCMAEIPDVNVIYNVHEGTDKSSDKFFVDAEIHSTLHSLGKLFLFENKTNMSPISSRSLPSFECFLTNESCGWRTNDTWTPSSLGSHILKNLSLTHDFKLTCGHNNGGCQVTCQELLDGPMCSCPPRFSLNKDNRTCAPKFEYHYIFSDDTGVFQSPGYPYKYPNYLRCSWLIVTSREKVINLHISSLYSEKNFDILTAFDGLTKEIGRWSGNGVTVDVTSTGNVMLVTFNSDQSNFNHGFEARYVTNANYEVLTHKLLSDTGMITSSFIISQSNLCVSLIYLMPSKGSLNISANQPTAGTTYFRQIHTIKVNDWHISRFVPGNDLDTKDNPVNLNVHVTGQESIILNIEECSSEGEDVYILPNLIRERNSLWEYANTDPENSIIVNSTKCSHGGIYSAGNCICPSGFAGPTCNEACGPNHFGSNCNSVCSWSEKGCKNMIFCNTLHSCTCATGFSGVICEEECHPGTYGANCQHNCGQCKEGSCDIYTGECDSLCEEGYHPPLCQQRYTFLGQAPIVKEKSWNFIEISVNFTNIIGVVPPYLYEVQYKEMGVINWTKTSIQEINSKSIVLTNVTDLKVGTKYLLRAVIICDDGNSYQGSDVPVVEFETLCLVPDSNVYEMESRNITSSSFVIIWKYPIHSDKWCPVILYEVSFQEGWKTYSQKVLSENAHTVYSNLLPGHQYTVRVCGITKHGKAPCSSPFTVMTTDKAPAKVRQLRVESRNAWDVHISWRRPLFTGGSIKGYRIQYECVKHLICEESCRNFSGSLETTEFSTNIINLLPHAQYKIRVAAYSASQGPYAILFATTKSTNPTVSPTVSDQQIVSKTNTTVTVQWQPPYCLDVNGYLTGYYFTLFSEFENELTYLQNGTTKYTQKNFTALSPKTEYQVHVYAMNSHGWNTDYKLIIPFSSSATVPEAVQDLQVYKKGRRMLGIRWGKPTKLYGTLKSFTVSYQQKDTENRVVETVPPTVCSGWPHLYCHTITHNLKPDKHYVVSVRARNSEIDEDGVISEVTTVTRENAPNAPSSLNLLTSTSISFVMEWRLPDIFNGELRSFLVNVEHVESLNDTQCCEYFPVQELPFREESPSYNLEVTGLIPASTYIVSVSAKTITLGPSINATYHTAPLPPTNLKPPQVVGMAEDYSLLIKVQPVSMHLNSNSTYLLLVLPPEELSPSVIWKPKLLEKLTQTVNQSFYIVAEFTTDDFVNEQDVKIGTGSEVRNGILGTLKDPKFTPGTYSLGLALVQTYGDAISVGLATSDQFEIDEFLEHTTEHV